MPLTPCGRREPEPPSDPNGTIYVTGENSVEFNTSGNGTINQNYGINAGAGGRLEVLTNGVLGTVTINSGKEVVGNGQIVNALTIATGAGIRPGASPGYLETGNFTLAGTYFAELNGTSAINQHDQISVLGSVDLTGGTLNATLGYAPTNGDKLYIVVNDDIDSVTGNFVGLADESAVLLTFNAVTYNFTISYDGNSTTGATTTGGNDVVLYFTAIPEPSVALLLFAGLGAMAARRRRNNG